MSSSSHGHGGKQSIIHDPNACILDYCQLKVRVQTNACVPLPNILELERVFGGFGSCAVEQVGASNQYLVRYRLPNSGLLASRQLNQKSFAAWKISQLKYGWTTYCSSLFYPSSSPLSHCRQGVQCEKAHAFKEQSEAFVPTGDADTDQHSFDRFKMYRARYRRDCQFVVDLDFVNMEGITLSGATPDAVVQQTRQAPPVSPQGTPPPSQRDAAVHNENKTPSSRAPPPPPPQQQQRQSPQQAQKKSPLVKGAMDQETLELRQKQVLARNLLLQQLNSGHSPNLKIWKRKTTPSMYPHLQSTAGNRRVSPPPRTPPTVKAIQTAQQQQPQPQPQQSHAQECKSREEVSPAEEEITGAHSVRSMRSSRSTLFHAPMHNNSEPDEDDDEDEDRSVSSSSSMVATTVSECSNKNMNTNRSKNKDAVSIATHTSCAQKSAQANVAVDWNDINDLSSDHDASTKSESEPPAKRDVLSMRYGTVMDQKTTVKPVARVFRSKRMQKLQLQALVRQREQLEKMNSKKKSMVGAHKTEMETETAVDGHRDAEKNKDKDDAEKHPRDDRQEVNNAEEAEKMKEAEAEADNISVPAAPQLQSDPEPQSQNDEKELTEALPSKTRKSMQLQDQQPQPSTTASSHCHHSPPRPQTGKSDHSESSISSAEKIALASAKSLFSPHSLKHLSRVPLIDLNRRNATYPMAKPNLQQPTPQYATCSSATTAWFNASSVGAQRSSLLTQMAQQPMASSMSPYYNYQQQPAAAAAFRPMNMVFNSNVVTAPPPHPRTTTTTANTAAPTAAPRTTTTTTSTEPEHTPQPHNQYGFEYNYAFPPPHSQNDYFWLCYHFASDNKGACRDGKVCPWRHYDFIARADVVTKWHPDSRSEAPLNSSKMETAKNVKQAREAKFPWLKQLNESQLQTKKAVQHKQKKAQNPYMNIPTPPSIKKQRVENFKRLRVDEEKQKLEFGNDESKHEEVDDQVTMVKNNDAPRSDAHEDTTDSEEPASNDDSEKKAFEFEELDTIYALMTPFRLDENKKINYYVIGNLVSKELEKLKTKIEKQQM